MDFKWCTFAIICNFIHELAHVKGQLGQLEVPLPSEIYPLRAFGPKSVIDSTSITMSGISSGAFMSMQFHFAHSSLIKGVGMFAGGPYGKAFGYPFGTIGGGLNWITFTVLPYIKTVPELVQQARKIEANGFIDPLSNLNGSRAFIFHGEVDPIVQYGEGIRAAEMYQDFGTDVKLNLFPTATHTMPTNNYGGPCEIVDIVHDAVNNCGYEGTFDMFGKLYDNFVLPPSSSGPAPAGSYFYAFDQSPFVPLGYNANTTRAYMAQNGFVYIPADCRNNAFTCRLHVALHGCFQSSFTELFPDNHALKSGYLQVADANNVVIVFPQASPHYFDAGNTNWGCWDFFGGTTPGFLYKSAPQIQTLYNIIAALTGLQPNQ